MKRTDKSAMSDSDPSQYRRRDGGMAAGAMYEALNSDKDSPKVNGKPATGATRILRVQVVEFAGSKLVSGVNAMLGV